MARLYSPRNVYITSMGHPWPVEIFFNTRSTGWSYDDLSDIMWNFWKNKLCIIFFSKPRDFVNGSDLVAQSTGQPLWNPLTKIRSYTNHAWKWLLCYKLWWFYWNVVLFNISSSWRLVIFLLFLLNEIRLHLFTPCKGSEQTFLTCKTVLWGLGYNNKVGCGHGSSTWQLMQQPACPSFARNHWLE